MVRDTVRSLYLLGKENGKAKNEILTQKLKQERRQLNNVKNEYRASLVA